MYVFLSVMTEQNNDCTQSLSCISQLFEKGIIFSPLIYVMHVAGTCLELNTRNIQVFKHQEISDSF